MRGLVRLAAAMVAVMVTALVGVSPGMASAAGSLHRPVRRDAHASAGGGLGLARAPAGLRAAVRRTLGSPAVSAGSAFQQAKLTAVGGAAGDQFGYAVALSGSTAVVGAPSGNSGTGAAYVFIRSGSTWSRQAELTATGGAAGDGFGFSVAITGSTVVAGAPFGNSGTGAAYVFTRSGTVWSQRAELTATGGAAGDEFGGSVAISGSTVLAGAPESNIAGTGVAYVFAGSGASWSQKATLTDPGGAANDRFGWSVAIAGSTAVVGAPGSTSFTGAAYAFVGSGSTWARQATLTAADGGPGEAFGFSVAIAGSTAVAGAPAGGAAGTGTAYVFTRSGTTWSQQAELAAAGGAAGDYFGASVAIAGSTLVVGASDKNSDTGAAYVFTRSGSTWSQEAELAAAGGAAGDYFGASVALSGSTVVAGAYGSNSSTGAAYVFVLPSRQATLTAADGAAGNEFGGSVAIAGSTAVVGAPGKNSSAGAAYVFVRSGTSWSQQAEFTDPGGTASDFFGASVAVSGSTAVVGAPDSNSLAGAAYVYVRSGASWSQQATLTVAGSSLFGDSVAIAGSTAVVGAPAHTTGAAYVFTQSGTTWSQQAELTAADGAFGDDFGSSVAISGSTAVVGAPGKNATTGAAYVFVSSGTSWSQQQELTATGGASGNHFGGSVAIAGSTAVVGAVGGNSGAGAAYVFARSGAVWSQQAELTAADGAAGDGFGGSVAIAGSTAMVGAKGNNSSAGAAYIFARSGSAWSQQAEFTDPGVAANDDFGGSVAIAKSTAVVGAEGGNSGTGTAYVFVNV